MVMGKHYQKCPELGEYSRQRRSINIFQNFHTGLEESIASSSHNDADADADEETQGIESSTLSGRRKHSAQRRSTNILETLLVGFDKRRRGALSHSLTMTTKEAKLHHTLMMMSVHDRPRREHSPSLRRSTNFFKTVFLGLE